MRQPSFASGKAEKYLIYLLFKKSQLSDNAKTDDLNIYLYYFFENMLNNP